MALPVVNGQSWITGSQKSTPVYLALPVPDLMSYTTVLGDYAECGTNLDYIAELLPLAVSDVNVSKNTSTLEIIWQNYTTHRPGLIDRLIYRYDVPITGIKITLGDIKFHYGLVSSSVERTGVFLNGKTGSPNLSLEGTTTPSNEIFHGDLWYENGSLLFGDVDGPRTFLAAKLGTTIPKQVGLYTASLGSTNRIITAKASVVNNWYVTVGTGWKNNNWAGGLFMPDPDTVAVFGEKNFKVPSGSIFSLDILLNRQNNAIMGKLNAQSSTVHSIQTPSLWVNNSNANISLIGESSSFKINASLATTLTETTGSFTLSTNASNGDMYIFRSDDSVYIKAANTWHSINSPPNIDGGTF